MNKSVSSSRTYVAMCNNTNFDGYYFKKFVLPESYTDYAWCHVAERFSPVQIQLPNDSESASWYFLNKLNFSACIEGCISLEDFINLLEEQQ